MFVDEVKAKKSNKAKAIKELIDWAKERVLAYEQVDAHYMNLGSSELNTKLVDLGVQNNSSHSWRAINTLEKYFKIIADYFESEGFKVIPSFYNSFVLQISWENKE
jgi:hypothetical protein